MGLSVLHSGLLTIVILKQGFQSWEEGRRTKKPESWTDLPVSTWVNTRMTSSSSMESRDLILVLRCILTIINLILDGSAVKNPPAMQELKETRLAQSLGREDPLEESMANPMDRGTW